MNKLKSKKGFTLIELIIVIAILGVILLIGVPRFTDVLKRAQVNADRSTAASIGKSVRLWNIDNLPSNRPVPTTFTEFVAANSDESTDSLYEIDGYFSIETEKPASFNSGNTTGSYYIKADASGKIAVAISTEGEADTDVNTEVMANTNGGAPAPQNKTFPASQDEVLYGKFNTDAGWAYLEQ